MDVVVTVPAKLWAEWLAEGDQAGEADSRTLYYFRAGRHAPRDMTPGEDRVYVVAHGKLRGYAILDQIAYDPTGHGRFAFARRGGAVACTIDTSIVGFRGWRRRWWERIYERPFPDWRTP